MNHTKGGFPVWDEAFDREHFTAEEIAESDLQASIIAAMADARKKDGVSQRQLETISGVKQPVIARIERGTVSPRLDTLLKLLAAMGKTLAVVPLPEKH